MNKDNIQDIILQTPIENQSNSVSKS